VMAKRRRASTEDEIATLYSLPLDEFTAKRDALAKRLRDEDDRAEAERIRKLKKPTRSAWAVNRGARADPAAARRLIDAGKRLEGAQNAALGGGGSAKLKEAMAGQQAAIEEMMGAIQEGLGSERVSSAILDRARETLRAVAGDEQLAAEFAAGRITADREAVGFAGSAPATPPPRAKREQPEPGAAERREAERKLKRAARALDAATKRAESARKRRDRAQEALDAARGQHDDAERERAEREAEVAAARDELGLVGGG
jgi:hypothetical protein